MNTVSIAEGSLHIKVAPKIACKPFCQIRILRMPVALNLFIQLLRIPYICKKLVKRLLKVLLAIG